MSHKGTAKGQNNEEATDAEDTQVSEVHSRAHGVAARVCVLARELPAADPGPRLAQGASGVNPGVGGSGVAALGGAGALRRSAGWRVCPSSR